MKDEIIVFTHNDADALGCMLCVQHKLPQFRKKFYHTNYVNITEKTNDIIEYQKQNQNSHIFILDISFSNHKHELIELIETGCKVLFIDHHLYPEDYFEELRQYKNFSYIHDVNKSATMLSYEYFVSEDKNEQDNLYKIVNLIDVYDIWQFQRSEFIASQYFNEYFWKNASNMSLELLMYKIIDSGWKIPDDFNPTVKQIHKEILETKESLEKRNLIFRSDNITVIFTDKYFNWIVQDEFKEDKDVCIIVNDWGLIRVRISEKSKLTKEQKNRLRVSFTGTENIGHDNAFTWKIEEKISFDVIMKHVKNVSNKISEEINKIKE